MRWRPNWFGSKERLPLPPMVPGWPLLGNLIAYRKDHIDVFRRAYAALGPVFSIRLGPQKAAVLIGPEHNRFFFSQVDKLLSMPEVYKFVIPMFGEVLNAAEDESIRKKHLALIQSAFQGGKMDRHVATMVDEIALWLDDLGDEGAFEIYEAISELTMKIAASAFMGAEIRAQLSDFLPLYEDLARGMEFVLPPNLPLPRFRRRDRARAELIRMIGPIIEERKARPDRHRDFFQTIIEGSYGEGGQASPETVVGLALMTVFTGYITTAAQTCWSLVQLLQHPRHLGMVRDEVDRLAPAGISAASLNRMHRLDWSVTESQRMHPVMSHYARYNTRDYTLSGLRIPKGWLTMVCPAVSHRLPEVFPNPDEYDPTRFDPDKIESRRHPYSLIGFGGGFYRCPGSKFGIHEMKAIVAMLLDKYDLELMETSPGRDFEMGVIRPKPPCRVRYALRRPRRYRAESVEVQPAALVNGPLPNHRSFIN